MGLDGIENPSLSILPKPEAKFMCSRFYLDIMFLEQARGCFTALWDTQPYILRPLSSDY